MKASRQEQPQVFCETLMVAQSFKVLSVGTLTFPLLWLAANSGAFLVPWRVRESGASFVP